MSTAAGRVSGGARYSPLGVAGYSVLFLQETHTTPDAEVSLQLNWGDSVYFSHLTKISCGLQPEILHTIEMVLDHLLQLQVPAKKTHSWRY